ncbi:hypothetical protein [Microbacterium sp. CH12i]|uniref:hypothetical protein n=1 Tax=Microbacterium sp. CH12i TaxID=1479651 RepID=UPI00068C3C28|nr:hypothetical protein [Microbacterium sp. CH12i]
MRSNRDGFVVEMPRSCIPVDGRRAHRLQLADRLARRERFVEISGASQQRQPDREHHHEVLPARQPINAHMLKQQRGLIAIRLRAKPSPIDLLGRLWQRRSGQHPPGA